MIQIRSFFSQILRAGVFRGLVVAAAIFGATLTQAQEPAVGLHYGSDFAISQYDAFGSWLGRKVLYRLTFLEKTSWSSITDAPLIDKSAAWVKSYPGRVEVISVPMFANGDAIDFTAITSGKRDSAFRSVASKIQAAGIADKVIVRLAWEANGNWYNWSYLKNPSAFKAAWRRIVSVMRSAAPNLRFEFNISNLASRNGGAKWTEGYPGDDVVNVISMDIYDHWNSWETMMWGDAGLNEMRTFAKAHGKPEAYAEWSLSTTPNGHGDNPAFVRAMAQWMDARPGGVLYQAYWNSSGGANALVYTTGTLLVPNGSAEYKKQFGPAPVSPTGNTAPTISSISNRIIQVNGSTGAIGFTIGDAQTSASNLKLITNVSDPSVIPLSRVVLGGTGSSRTVTVSPITNKTGWSTVWIKVSDGSLSKTISFVVQVRATLSYGDIGGPNVTGSQSISGTAITMKGSGIGITKNSDEFRFGHLPLNRDAELTVKVSSLTSSNTWSKAGLMFRGSTAADSAFVGLFVTPSEGVVLQWRATNGGATAVRPPVAGRAPKWLRLTRDGDNFYAFYSSNGVDWDLVETTGVNLPDTARCGIAVTSHAPTTLATAVFDQLEID